mmetsp:Transcript_76566/g.206280  ORF Transcript_76566/g.206280 Transcript_76566/m.206280 type:complete len:235 (+) Transcript_76566:68-772(+)
MLCSCSSRAVRRSRFSSAGYVSKMASTSVRSSWNTSHGPTASTVQSYTRRPGRRTPTGLAGTCPSAEWVGVDASSRRKAASPKWSPEPRNFFFWPSTVSMSGRTIMAPSSPAVSGADELEVPQRLAAAVVPTKKMAKALSPALMRTLPGSTTKRVSLDVICSRHMGGRPSSSFTLRIMSMARVEPSSGSGCGAGARASTIQGSARQPLAVGRAAGSSVSARVMKSLAPLEMPSQ